MRKLLILSIIGICLATVIIKAGPFDFITKPFEKILKGIKNAANDAKKALEKTGSAIKDVSEKGGKLVVKAGKATFEFAKDQAQKAANEIKNVADKTANEVKDVNNKAQEFTKKAAQEGWNKVEDAANEAIKKSKQTAQDTINKIETEGNRALSCAQVAAIGTTWAATAAGTPIAKGVLTAIEKGTEYTAFQSAKGALTSIEKSSNGILTLADIIAKGLKDGFNIKCVRVFGSGKELRFELIANLFGKEVNIEEKFEFKTVEEFAKKISDKVIDKLKDVSSDTIDTFKKKISI